MSEPLAQIYIHCIKPAGCLFEQPVAVIRDAMYPLQWDQEIKIAIPAEVPVVIRVHTPSLEKMPSLLAEVEVTVEAGKMRRFTYGRSIWRWVPLHPGGYLEEVGQ